MLSVSTNCHRTFSLLISRIQFYVREISILKKKTCNSLSSCWVVFLNYSPRIVLRQELNPFKWPDKTRWACVFGEDCLDLNAFFPSFYYCYCLLISSTSETASSCRESCKGKHMSHVKRAASRTQGIWWMMEKKALRKNGNCFCGSLYEPEERAAAARMEDAVFYWMPRDAGVQRGSWKGKGMKLPISCGQCGILEAVTPECGWLLVSNCDGALWESSKK